MENLPSELLYIVFSFLDKKSRKSATATCQLWFDVIRNSNLSNHIFYDRTNYETSCVKKLQERIENLEWDWNRWPALKTFELQGYGDKGDLLNEFPIDFKQCPSLELVSLNTNIDIEDLIPNYPQNSGAEIRKLAFNPQLDIQQFGGNHIWSLMIDKRNDEVFKLINENVKGLKVLWVNNFNYLNDLVCKDDLVGLHIIDFNSSELKIDGLKKLKTLEVYSFAQLDNLVGIDALLELSVTSFRQNELKEYDLSNIAKRFKNLQKCEINARDVDGLKPEEYAQIVQGVFQDSATRVKIVLLPSQAVSSPTYLITKEPFQRCVVKQA